MTGVWFNTDYNLRENKPKCAYVYKCIRVERVYETIVHELTYSKGSVYTKHAV